VDELKHKEIAYSGERAPVAPVTSPAEVPAQAASAGNAVASAQAGRGLGSASLLEAAKSDLPSWLAEILAFLMRTKRVWLMAAGILIAAAALVNLTARAAEWAKNSRERRQLHAAAALRQRMRAKKCIPW
jgi:hypothetical protein